MNFLIVGAGAIGGYFGGRLIESGADVTFLVRENRRNQLEQDGLVIESVHGHFSSRVKTITPDEKCQTFDMILVALKAYHLERTVESLAGYMHERTLILPLLNGYQHYQTFFNQFGQDRVLGGLCFIETTLANGVIVQSSPRHDVVFGGWDGNEDERIRTITESFSKANCNAIVSDHIQADIWQKYIFIASLSGITSLFRSSIGPIVENRHTDKLLRSLIEEICSIAQKKFDFIPEHIAETTYNTSKLLHYTMKSSMLRDMEKGLPTETEHLQGYLLKLADGDPSPILETVYSNLVIYEKNNIAAKMRTEL
ncbi:ketopantoate reductase family protein [Paenibacillus piri]|uniref:2-dehydropantoate 2-reductase n=1 Tax=Paenibacillus piri TaxID=2547395 RepID=A0A4R5KV97_9BACL|nr:ketopantoate reductase family protein [Paenibacillus piri]TDF99422.1 ketopantoate reductase family protein [Paenibacillus piri]